MRMTYIRRQAEIAICVLALTAGGAIGSPASAPASAPAKPALRVVMFGSRTCPKCEKVENILAELAAEKGDRIEIEKLYTDDEGGDALDRLDAYDRRYDAGLKNTPVIFVGERFLPDKRITLERLGRIVEEELAKGSTTYRPTAEDLVALRKDPGRFDRINIVAIVAAGLLDGINPCAFATIIFLVSMLAHLGKSRRDILAVGIGFTVAVFVTYLLLGLAAFKAIKVLAVDSRASLALTWTAGLFALVLAAWSLVDFVRYSRSGDAKDATLALPKFLRLRINTIIRERLKTRGLLIGSVTIGFLVAIIESLCTGQVYLPTIMLMVRTPGIRANGLAYLLLYNVLFILPLVAILGVAYCGVTSERLAKFLRRHLGLIKLSLAVLFATLGVLVLRTVW